MYMIQRLKKDGILDNTQASRLSGSVAKRDFRLMRLVQKHERRGIPITRNEEFRAELVLLGRESPRPPPPRNQDLEAQLPKKVHARVEKSAASASQNRMKLAAFVAHNKELLGQSAAPKKSEKRGKGGGWRNP
eukprot:CAMPEP_0172643682 /NCGR_PEP_ID=MMETSP1068-20121228/237960_1 /TAXON_ID=35684 /ORGANISM="Pseudopedinella elastica, Strain CCMP716" /LENGTH=132 /DNA_ID=CAMNT_0013457795 /DNA_START=229 /DNA_END=627 /DNA_ORIENTATION=-